MCVLCYLKNLYPVCVYILFLFFESHKTRPQNLRKYEKKLKKIYDEKSTTGAEEKDTHRNRSQIDKIAIKMVFMAKEKLNSYQD